MLFNVTADFLQLYNFSEKDEYKNNLDLKQDIISYSPGLSFTRKNKCQGQVYLHSCTLKLL